MEPATRRQLLGLAVGGGFVAAAALLVSPATVVQAVDGAADRPLAFLALLVAVYLCRPFVLWPISAVSVVVGYVYGLGVGIPVALAGAVVTSLPPFLLARYTRSEDGLFGALGETGERLVETTGMLRGVFAARLAPLPTDPVSYAAGLSGVGLGTFALGTALGELPWVAAAVLAGHSMSALSFRGAAAGPWLVAGAAALALVLLAGPAYRHLRGETVQ
ncbi:MAG: TVP38/TMEM64 family protein [Halorientalis sp.]